MMKVNTGRVYNFSPGPCCLPIEVLLEAQTDLLNYNGSGMSVMEMSHRGTEFLAIYNQTVNDLKELLQVPDTHQVLFMQGGGTLQFSAVPFNLIPSCGLNKLSYADYVTTGDKAAKEAEKYIQIHSPTSVSYEITQGLPITSLCNSNDWVIYPESNYVHYCANETIQGIEFHSTPHVNIPLVSDMSSNFCSKPIDIQKHTIIYAGIQKNLGPAGCTIVIADKHKINPSPLCPAIMNYELMFKYDSMYNTPACWCIYITGLMLKYLKQKGGLAACDERRQEKARLLYDYIDSTDGYYMSPVDKSCRSFMNIPFRVGYCNDVLEKEFVIHARQQGLIHLEGHRSVGGCRASIYNGMTTEGVEKLLLFMKEFKEENPTPI